MVQTLKSLTLQTRILLIVLAAALVGCVVMMAVSPARSALTYFSGEYVAEIQQTHIGVALTENDAVVPEGGNLIADSSALLKRPTADNPDNVDQFMIPGEVYSERLSVQNRSSDMDEYVRLTVRKYWAKGAEGDGSTADTRAKTDKLDPSLIQLQFTDESAEYWVRADDECTAEREVFYYKTVLPAGEAAEYPAVTGIRIDPSIKDVREDYSNCWLALEAQVDSVQVNNAPAAAKSAWGVDVTQEAFAAAGLNWSQEG